MGRPVRLEAAVPVPEGQKQPKTLPMFSYTHQITKAVFDLVRDDTDYTVPEGSWTPPKPPRTLAEAAGANAEGDGTASALVAHPDP